MLPVVALLGGSAVVGAGLAFIRSYFKNSVQVGQVNTSLVTTSKPVHVEPMCLIDSSLKASETLSDVQHSLLNMYAGFYLQSVVIALVDKEMKIGEKLSPFGTKVGLTDQEKQKELQSKTLLGAFATDVNKVNHLAGEKLGFESYTGTTFKEISESLNKANKNVFTGELLPRVSTEDSEISLEDISAAIKEIKDDSRLSVGKVIPVTIRDRGLDGREKEVQIPVGIRLVTGFLRSDYLIDILALKDTSALDRKIAYQTGKLSLFADIVFCRDLYKQFRKNLIKDKTGYFKTNLDKHAQTSIDQILSGKKRTTGITTLTVISSATARAIEARLNIKLDNYAQRNSWFMQSGLMIVAVVDDDYRMVKLYFHDVEKPIEATFNDVKKASKGDPNISDIVTALSMGQAPRLY